VIFTGFAETGERLNVQGLMNSFNWTLDNRIHGAAGLMGGRIRGPSGKVLELRGKDFSFDPRNPADIRAESGGGQHGMTFTDDGRKLVCHNSAHIKLVMYEERYANRNPYYSMPPPVIDIAVDGPAAEVYRISPVEPWRVLRTQWRVAGKVPGPVEGGGRASGYFTSATGITVYRGNAFPEEYRGDAFIADVGSNLIHRKKLHPKGLELEARRPDDEQKVEFIASKDLWFRPVQFANAPDGCLYLADMYREVMEHPWSIPESIKQHLDLNSGNDRGRIYRIAPKRFRPRKPPFLGTKNTAELVRLLQHPNGWTRETAARLLYQRQDQTCIAALKRLTWESKNPLGRMHALYALAGQNALSEQILARATEDRDTTVRQHAVRLSTGSVAKLARDPSIRVRYQVALTGTVDPPAFPSSDITNRWMRSAILSFYNTSEKALAALNSDDVPPGVALVLAEIIGAANTADHPRKAVERVKNNPVVALALAKGLARAGGSLRELGTAGDRFLEVLRGAKSQEERAAALNTLGRFPDSSVTDEILKSWNTFSQQLRSQAISVLLARAERAKALLDAVANGTVDPNELSSLQIRQLLEHKDNSVRVLAAKTLGQDNPPKRADVIATFREALTLKGNPENGRKFYQERCASCHRFGSEGQQLGPDLITVKTAGKEKLLESILDPNREVLPQYVAQTVETKSGDSLVGLIANENAAAVTLREAFGKETVIPRTTIQKIQSQKQSIMPEGLEAGMTPQDMADLLEFVVR
jgi:putative membrane-bound dehydrogenase-like protein